MATPSAARQQREARQQLTKSIANLNRTANAIAAQQASQEAARALAYQAPPSVPDGLVAGGLEVATGAKAGWVGADGPVVSADGRTVAIKQNADRAILNWETFNVGRNTTLKFDQQATDAVLNKVVGASAAPSQIQGRIQAAGTVMVVNQNGVVFSGTSQVDVRNLVAAAAKPDAELDAQFLARGIYSNGTTPTFKEALGNIEVRAGARLNTPVPTSATEGGGYVLLAGQQVVNAGAISTPNGQALLAAGENFVIARGYGTDGNPLSTTRGNVVTPASSAAHLADAASGVGRVTNAGLIQAATGDITLTGREVVQVGVVIATTSTSVRGTVHLLNPVSASDGQGRVTLAPGSVTAVVLDDSASTAFDSQREAGRANPSTGGDADAPYALNDFRDLSRIEITSDNTVEFQGNTADAEGSLTLATGGQIVVQAAKRALLGAGAQLDVAGAMGVRVAMEANNLRINAQGNEQRDAPINRDGGNLNSSDIWLDRRSLVYVPAGTQGYDTDRWYTAGGLLEVSGYLATSGRTVGEWMAQGGTVSFAGADVVTRAGSGINLSGGTLDVQDGALRQTWLRGADGRLYVADRAPADLLYQGIYRGYEVHSTRWGQTRRYYDAMMAPTQRQEAGYTVGRDAGRLVIGTTSALLEGEILSDVYQGARQTQAAQASLDGLYQSQAAVARRGQLIVGEYIPHYYPKEGLLRYRLSALAEQVHLGESGGPEAEVLTLDEAVAPTRAGKLVLDTGWLNTAQLGALRVAAKDAVTVAESVSVAPGGEIALHASRVDVGADLVARSGRILLGNVLAQPTLLADTPVQDVALPVSSSVQPGVFIGKGATLDVRGLQANEHAAAFHAMPYIDGGSIVLRSTHDVSLSDGSLIDASAGAVVNAKGAIQLGGGGSVRLGAGLLDGPDAATLTLDGDIRALGGNRAGTLDIESRSAVVIGGEVLDSGNLVRVGQALPVDVITAEDFIIRAGEVLPVEHRYDSWTLLPGMALSATSGVSILPASGRTITVEADWKLPPEFAVFDGSLPIIISADGRNWMQNFGTGPTIPAGTVLTTFVINPRSAPIGWTVSADVFPSGVPLSPINQPAQVVLAAGSIAPQDITFGAGLRLQAGSVLSRPVKVSGLTQLAPELFQSGFAQYQVRGHHGLVVTPGTQLAATRPVWQGGQAGEAVTQEFLQSWLPPEYLVDQAARTVGQRGGASVSLAAGRQGIGAQAGDAGTLTIGAGARLAVDAGQSISLSARSDLRMEGELTARGGAISLMGARTGFSTLPIEEGGNEADARASQRAIWLGEHAVVDVSAASHVELDPAARPYGQLLAGGRIVVGGEVLEAGSRAPASDAFIVIRPGAVLDASGGAAVLDLDGRGARTLYSDGGDISLVSGRGLYLDGVMRAHAGGEGAAGGRLTVGLDVPAYLRAAENAVRLPRELVLSQTRGVASDTLPSALVYGQGALGVDQVQAGGFDGLTLFSQGLVSVAGSLDLTMPGELRIYSGAFAKPQDAAAQLQVRLAAPYVLLSGITDTNSPADTHIRPVVDGSPDTAAGSGPTDGQLLVSGNHIDIKGSVSLGVKTTLPLQTGTLAVEREGFARTELRSEGDIRFLEGAPVNTFTAQLLSAGDVMMTARQVYPATHVQARVVAGRTASGLNPEAELRIAHVGDASSPAQPYSVFGGLTLRAANIYQGGVLRAPLGTLTLGTAQDVLNVVLAPGSETSVSAMGLVMPYGGTMDGVSYRYRDADITPQGVGSTLQGAVILAGRSIAVQPGAILDLSGGGELTGAGFVSGRGGSTDARLNPMIRLTGTGFDLPGLDTNPVYALVPGYAAPYAPAWDGVGAIDPAVGRQVVIGAGVPGLPAGTYTLLPSQYSLLPGAFRVERNGGQLAGVSRQSVRLRNGSFVVAGVQRTANTDNVAGLAEQWIVTPADVVRRMSQYNETGYSDFLRNQAALRGIPRALLPEDGKSLWLRLVAASGSDFSFQGEARFTPAKGGYGGTATVSPLANQGSVEIVGAGAGATTGFNGLTLRASDLTAIGAPRLAVGGRIAVSFHGEQSNGTNESNYLDFSISAANIVLRSGAVLRAPEVFLATNTATGGITVEDGAGIISIGAGAVPYGSEQGYVYRPGPASVLAVSNAWLDVLAPEPDATAPVRGAGAIRIGTCTVSCHAGSQLYSEGTILAATTRAFEMADTARYGTRNLVLAVSTVNAGERAALEDAAARGVLTPGLSLNQGLLDRLLQGDQAHGAPALERLVLTAGQSFNLFGNVALTTRDPITGRSTLDNLVLSTPAIYGHGQAGDIATISTGTLTWAALSGAAPAPIQGGRGTGSGSLRIAADVIEMGYGPNTQPNGIDDYARLVLGFQGVEFQAAQRFTANHKGSLAVYARQSGVDEQGPQYEGGNLTLTTPLVTGEGGSVNRLKAGAALVLRGAGATAAPAATIASGAELALEGGTVTVDTRIAMPSGKVSMKSQGDLRLLDGAQLDLAGRRVDVHDASYYGWGGDVVLESVAGNILQSAGSLIDVSAQYNHAGLISAFALDASAGRVSLGGALRGTTVGTHDAGGTWVPYRSGGVDIRAQHIGEGGSLSEAFADVNARLTAGGFLDERKFQLKQGDLSIGDELAGRVVDVSLDAGHLTVAGRIDASGSQVGTIRLAGKQGLTIASTAMLDAHGTVLRLDSYGQVIDAANRAVIDLNAGDGLLTLAGGARMDLRHGTADARVQADPSLHDAVARGQLSLYAPRVSETGGDILVDASNSIDIQGARSIALYAMQRYDDSDPALVQRWRHGGATPRLDANNQADDEAYREINQAYLDAKHDRSVAFINAALGNSTLTQQKLAGLNNNRYRDAFHLRPGVEITSEGALVVTGDLDLSRHRYASLNPTVRPYVAGAAATNPAYGGGEAGALTVRAQEGLEILGSINDGFAPAPTTPDDSGWVLVPGVQPFGGDVRIPIGGVQLADGTVYPKGKTLNYAVTARNVALPVGTLLPVAVTLGAPLTLPEGTALAANVLASDGSVLLAAGASVSAGGLVLPAGAQFLAGSRLPAAVTVARLTWPLGVPLPVNLVQDGAMTLPLGALLPAGVDVKLASGTIAVTLRAAGGTRNWALSQMLAEGSQSWDVRLVAGADRLAADSRRVLPGRAGGMVFADTHYSAQVVIEPGRNEPERWVWNQGAGYVPPGGTAHPARATPGGTVTVAIDRTRCISGVYSCTLMPAEVIPERVTAVDAKAPALSVVRTGTGDLDLISSGDVSMQSPYGIYTAGTPTSLGSAAMDALFNQPRGKAAGGASVLGAGAGAQAAAYESLVSGSTSAYRAWYPEYGGNFFLEAGGNVSGDAWGASNQLNTDSTGVGNWLWRQGTGASAGVNSQPTAWWINFGTYVADPQFQAVLGGVTTPFWPAQTGFTGMGTLGGGNLSLRVGGDAGLISSRSANVATAAQVKSQTPRSQGLVLAVGSSGRVLPDGELVFTGGGDLDLRVSGGWNAGVDARLRKQNGSVAQAHSLYGAVVNLRGATQVSAGQIGLMERIYGGRAGQRDPRETRATDPYTSSMTLSTGGLMLVTGDSAASLTSRGDLVLGGTGDPGRARTGNYQAYSGERNGQAGLSWFTLWTPNTSVQALSVGGSLASDTRVSEFGVDRTGLYSAAGGWFMLPGAVNLAAPEGNVYLGQSSSYQNAASGFVLQAPIGPRALSIAAGDSLYASGLPISQSGADERIMATIFQPAFAGFTEGAELGGVRFSNTSNSAAVVSAGALPMLVFGLNTVGQTVGLSDSPSQPVRFYAGTGDLVGVRTGAQARYATNGMARLGEVDYIGANPVWMLAGRDIVNTGTLQGENPLALPSQVGGGTSSAGPAFNGNLFVHGHANDVSVVQAGRDILYHNLMVAGPGTLDITAGRNIVQEDRASLTSLGPIVAGDSRRGASIVLQAGMGAQGANWNGFLARYLDPDNRIQTGLPLAGQAGRVVKTYESELIDWLAVHHGFVAPTDGSVIEAARALFMSLPSAQQRVFARQVYFAELREGGREYNDADGPRFGSYLRGRNAIATLFPETNDAGEAIVYRGDLLMHGGAGIHTNVGGDIQILTPGGSQTYGVEGAQPPGTAGLITRGQGNIQLYSLGSILLGQSRVMTTFGGDILAWSAQGDINAGRGSKTTVVFTPPRRVYDSVGNVSISPDVPSTGAGIATLNPLPEVVPGDVDLIAPLGTIDAGEAGIRVSGNVNIAALQVVNAANIQVQGDATGIPVVAAVNVGALTNASAAASSAADAAQDTVARSRAAARQALPSIISVQILGFGAEGGATDDVSPPPPARSSSVQPVSYNPSSTIQLVGNGQLSDAERTQLTAKERANAL
ncbi:Filamentous haemagglutinin family outer membrane protein associated with VreARI signalling system [plant metagenome]|uniref:Filamentous haemagglutinin family outer membrane protein associated with VreARI signalling system n=1 Tax=plant metagenome TaxID=1297885 RepID=A0A484PNH6_9ZZZZ